MNVGKVKKRIFGASILLLMTILAVGTVVFAESSRSSSYSLTIQKVFAPGTPAEAQNVEYTFRVQAQVTSGDTESAVEKEVKIRGEGSETIDFEGPFKISVIEQTEDGGFKLDGADWDVTRTECLSSIHVGESVASININKDNGLIQITRPADVPTVTFRVTGKALHDDKQAEFDRMFQPQTVTVAAGETKELTGLPQGEYTITKLRAADGFSVLVGPRDFHVDAGGTGRFHINGSESKVSITAPVPEDGSTRIHHYHLEGPVSRDLDIRSGETGTVEHLTEGEYTVRVSETYSGIEEFKATIPETTENPRNERSSAISTSSTSSYKYFTVGGDYIGNLTYGPLYNSKGQKLPATATYKFVFGALNPDDPTKINLWSMNRAAAANTSGNKVDLTGKDAVQRPLNGRLYVGTKEVSDSSAYRMGVSWTEYTLETNTYKAPETDVWYQLPIDNRGWITIDKPEDSNDPGHKVTYYYSITDSNGLPITGYTVTDQDGNKITNPTDKADKTVMLKAGESVTIQGLHDGIFHIQQTVEPLEPMGFRVKLEDTTKIVTTPGETINIETLGERRVEISRPGKAEDDSNRVYTYNIYQNGITEPIRTITLHSGETTTVAEQTGSMLPAGKYKIQAMDDQIVGFDVTYSDSSSLTSDYIKHATVSFTNYFSKVEASYHVVHEYYLKNSNGSYDFEGVSPVYTNNCDGTHDDTVGHYSKDVQLQEVYNGNKYSHFSDAYGKVISWPKGGTSIEVPLEEDDVPYTGSDFVEQGTGSNGPDTRDYAYIPLENLDCAMATQHDSETGAHEGSAQIIILRYYRESTPQESGKYNIIHEYYRRTSQGDIWEGSRAMETEDVGRLTDGNRYTTYSAANVDKLNRFSPNGQEYPYVYDSAAYGRIVPLDEGEDYNTAAGAVGGGQKYRVDANMSSVKATVEGDQIIILRYYRGGGYNVVHEYYYREKTVDAGSSDEVEDGFGEDVNPEEETTGQRSGIQPLADEASSFSGTLTNSEGYAYEFEGRSGISTFPAKLESRHDASEVNPVTSFQPDGDSRHDYVQKDAVYGYLNEDGTYRLAPHMTGGRATAQKDEIIILRYYREGEAPNRPDPATGSYQVVHEYYYRTQAGDTLEGSTAVESVEGLPLDETQYTADEVGKRPSFEGRSYTYFEAAYGMAEGNSYQPNADMTYVVATEEGQQIIILRYYRENGSTTPSDPKDPEDPPKDPEDPPKDPEDPPKDPENPPETPENPPETPENPPETPENPGYPTELPDPNDPNSPDEITIWEDGVPKSYVKVWDPENEEYIYILDEDVPLWNQTPQTGDESRTVLFAVLTLGALCGIAVLSAIPRWKNGIKRRSNR